MAVQTVLLIGCFLFVISVVDATSKDEILHTSLYRLAEGHIEKNNNRPFSSLPSRTTTTKPMSTQVTTLKPVYFPPSSTVKPTTKSTTEMVLEETTKSTVSGHPVTREHEHAPRHTMTNSGHTNKKIDESLVAEKKEHVKSKANPKHEETEHTVIQTAIQREINQNEIAEEKSGMFAAAAVIPFLASVGTALAIGGLAYYAFPVPAITARSDTLNQESFDNGVRIVQSSDLTPQELRRLMNAEAYHVSARSSTDERKPHPYIDLAKRVIQYATPVYQYLVPSFLGGNSDEEDTGNEYDLGRIQPNQPFAGAGYNNRLIQPIYNGGHQNIEPHILGQPNIGQNILAQPNVGQHIRGQHNIGQPIIGQHFIAQPNVGQHILGQQNIAQPNIGQHFIAQPNEGQHILGQQNIAPQNIGQHFIAQPNAGQHILGQQNIAQPNTGQHIFEQPNVGQQNIVQPNDGELHYNN